jgi:hypothetical protein
VTSQTMTTMTDNAEGIAELRGKLQLLRRMKLEVGAGPGSAHLQSALKTARQEPQTGRPKVSYIFIGISISSV